jgi:hypothetical protein
LRDAVESRPPADFDFFTKGGEGIHYDRYALPPQQAYSGQDANFRAMPPKNEAPVQFHPQMHQMPAVVKDDAEVFGIGNLNTK